MPSPFPGMDPYLESPRHWKDFHSRLINVLSEVIQRRLPPNYHATINEDVLLVEPEPASPRKEVGPDVLVMRDTFRSPGHVERPGAAAVAEPEPVIIPNVVRLDPNVEPFVEIRHLPDQEVVTVLELLSPTNKTGTGRGQYLGKRDRLLRDEINLVELDLIRGGQRLRLERPLPPGHYYAFVSRSTRHPDCEVYHWRVRDQLPKIPIPLKASDADVRIDLSDAFQIAYERGPYQGFVRYDEPPPPPAFEAADAEWVAQTARAAVR